MENQNEEPVTQNEPVVTPETTTDKVEITKAELEELKKKADASEQNFARLKKAEEKLKEQPLTPEKPEVDFDRLADFVSATKDLSREELAELTNEAKTLGVEPMKYLSSKSGKAHLNEFRQANKSTQATPTSSKIPTFNGKPTDVILRDPEAPASDKQAAFEARMRKKPNSNE